MAGPEGMVCDDCAAFMLTGSSSAAVLSENFAAASWARPAGSSEAFPAFVLAA